MSKLISRTFVLILTFFCASEAFAQAQFVGQYEGEIFTSVSGAASTPEFPSRTAASIDNAGNFELFGGSLTGTVDNAGAITFSPSVFNFTTGTLTGGVISATASVPQGNGVNVNTRLALTLSTGTPSGTPVGEFQLDQKRSLPALPPGIMRGIAYGNGKFVQVGQSGIIYVSTDGLNWTSPISPTTRDLRDVTFGNGRFVAVGDSATILHSTDAVNWTLTTYPRSAFSSALNIHGVAFGNGVFAAAGLSNLTLKSTDGIAWTVEGTSDFNVGWSGIDFVNGRFFYMGNRLGTLGARIITSTDASTFTAPVTVSPNKTLLHIAYLNGVYVSAGGAGNGGGFRFTSNDGSGATEVVAPSTITSVISDGTRFIASGHTSDYTSTDGLNWTVIPGSPGKGYDIAVGNGRVVFADSFRTSTDLTTWEGTRPPVIPGGSFSKTITSANGVILVAGSSGTAVTYDGINWEGSNSGVVAAFRGRDGFYGLTGSLNNPGGIARSGDGLTWTGVFSGPNTLRHIASGDDGYVAVGDQNFLIRSSDGINWTEVFAKDTTKPSFSKVIFGNGIWLTIQSQGRIRRSTDGGRTWAPDVSQNIRDLEFHAGQFVALRTNSSVATSPDGITWTMVHPSVGNFNFIDRVAGKWYIGGSPAGTTSPTAFITSRDLITWTSEGDRFGQNYLGLANIGPSVVFLTESGESLQSRIASQPLPFLVSSPTAPVVSVGGTLTLTGSFAGSNLTYQWFRSGTPLRNDSRISGATTPTLNITDLNGFDAGKYTLRAISGNDEAFTVPASVVLPALATITTQPTPRIDTFPGFEEKISVVATGTITSYQWRKNGTAISGATTASLTLSNLAPADAASYDCVITTAGGSITSTPAVVTISLEFPDPALIENPTAPARERKKENTTRIDLPDNTNIRYNSGWRRYDSTSGVEDRNWVSPISGYGGDSYKMPNGDFLLMRAKIPNVSSLQDSGFSVMRGDASAAEFYPVFKSGSQVNIFPKLIFTRNYIWIAGDFDTIAGHSTHRLARLNADGTVDTTFTLADTSLAVPSLLWDDTDGGVILGVPNPTRPAIHKAYADGSTDTAFFQVSRGANISWNITGLAIAQNGDLLVAGERFNFNSSFGTALWRFTRGGALSSTPLTQYNLSGWNFHQLDDGRLIFIAREQGSNIHKAYQFSENGGRKLIKTYAFNYPMTFEHRPIPSQPHNTAGIFGTDSTQLNTPNTPASIAIVSEPLDQTIIAGRPVSLSVGATGSFPLSYQWRKNGTNIPGATGPSLNLAFSEFANLAGNYSVLLSDSTGSILSRTAAVTDQGGGARAVAVPQTGFENWASQNGIPIDKAGPTDDADDDGVPNLLEFIAGTNPTGSSTLPTPVGFVSLNGESYQTISIVRRSGVSGYTMGAESSADMFRTAPVPAVESGLPEDLGNGFERVTYRSTVPVSASPRGFIRIVANAN
ncbi:hypothetical protein HZ994_13300 [Akkermansiaceae bacterium]|nr:hypothetical protein HZ994_13300 [Akkermansiaceae bacterium]